MRKARIVTFCILLLSLWSVEADAQATSRVAGVVKDSTAAIIAGAKVTLTNEATTVAVGTVTTSSGAYVFDGIVPGTYTVTVGAPGFSTFTSKGNTLTIAQPMVVNARLQVGEASIKMEVNAGAELVQTETSGNLGALIDQKSLTTLPVVGARGRSPLDLLELVPGVVDGGGFNSTGTNIAGGGVSVNGSRDRAWNYTLDGIDINETSAGGSNFSPLRTNPDSISGFRVITSNATSEYGRSSGAQVILETRSGTNKFHGGLFYFYQTPGLNANDPGNIAQGIGRPQFVQHIPGFQVGGPIFKDKTFFFVNMQFLHAAQSFLNTSTVYTSLARQGMFRYVTSCPSGIMPADCHNTSAGSTTSTIDANGNILPGFTVARYDIAANDARATGNELPATPNGLDPTIQGILNLTPTPNNFAAGDGLNTAGFTYLAPEAEKQVDFTVRIDHQFNSKNSIFGRWAHGHQNTVGDSGNGGLAPFPGAPNVVNTLRQPRNLAISWRYTPSSSLTNEVVVGMNRFVFNFINPDSNYKKNSPFVLNGISGPFGLALPRQNYVGNLRALTTIQLLDNMTYLRGAHAFRWGFNFRYQRHIDDRGSIGNLDAAPLVQLDIGTNPVDPTNYNLPNNIEPLFDLPALQNSINDLLGRVGQIQQGLVAKDANTYASAGTHLIFDFRMPEYDLYVQDSWKMRPNLVIDAGLRWEIKLAPRNTAGQILRPSQPFGFGVAPNESLTWAPGPLYKNAWKDFGPSIGIAWDPFNNGKMSIRANYRLAYDRINTFSLSSGVFQGLPGLTFQQVDTSFGGGGGRIADGVPTLNSGGITPTSQRTPPLFSNASITTIDSNWKPAQVHEWSLSIQRQIGSSMVFDISYVGKHGVHLYGGYDANAVDIKKNGFLGAFKTVQGGGDSPLIDQLLANDSERISSGVSGSAYLGDPNLDTRYFTAFGRGSVAELASQIANRQEGGQFLTQLAGLPNTFFFAYPQYNGGFDVLDSHDVSSYHSLQTSLTRRFSRGLTFQVSWVWSKSMDTRSFDPTFTQVASGSSTFGASSTPFDLFNRKLNYSPSDFDRTHVILSHWYYELPFGNDQKWGSNWNPILQHVISGWEVGGFATLESGHPTTVYSPAYTVSSIVRTPASCTGCTHDMFHVVRDSQGALTYLTDAQKGQFFNPAPGEFSNIGRNFFRLGRTATLNMTVGKITRLAKGHTLETRIEVQNVTNSVHYDQPASARINSPFFGSLDQTLGLGLGSSPRTAQLAVKYNF